MQKAFFIDAVQHYYYLPREGGRVRAFMSKTSIFYDLKTIKRSFRYLKQNRENMHGTTST